jgi:uncharacterized protein (TIRG00374 family)
MSVLPRIGWKQQGEDHRQPSGAVVQRPARKKWLSFGIRLGFTLLLFAFLFKSFSWTDLFKVLTHIQLAVVLLGMAVGAFSIVVSSYQWRSLLHAERISIDLARLINLYLVGIAFSHFLPTGMGGDAVKAFYVGRESGNHAGSASAVIMSRVTGFFGMLLVAFSALIFWHGRFAQNAVIWFILLSLIVGGMIAGTILCASLLPRLFKDAPANRRIFATAIRIGNALSLATRRPRSLTVAILFGILFWIVGCLNYYGYALALNLSVPLYFYFVAIPLVSLVAFLPISINGFGLREGAFVYVFSTIHVPIATSLLLAFLMDGQALLFGAIGGCIYLFAGDRRRTVEQQDKT